MAKISSLVPNAGVSERRRLTTEMGAVIDGLALNTMFNPEGISKEQRLRLLRLATRNAMRGAGASAAA
jgi:hypothetical protein